MQEFKKVLVRVNVDGLENHSVSSFGAKPKYCTGYKVDFGLTYIPLKNLIEQGFSFPYKTPEWYEQGTRLINNIPCYGFSKIYLEILAEN